MKKNKDPDGKSYNVSDEDNLEELQNTLKLAKNDRSVKDALKKEKQPETTEDLSYLHNTTQIGTTGGDQRASAAEIKRAAKPLKTLPGKNEKM